MLSKADNDVLTQVGAGTPMGDLIRRYWIPAMLASKVEQPNGDPVRVRLLGENFVVWRDAKGQLGVFDESCMHRGASLALARCEGDGLRCLYHHWKFATDGTILETPNNKKSNLRERRTAPTYPVREAGGLIWVYLGPPDKEPPLPNYAFMDTPDQQSYFHVNVDCNFVQLIEGILDSAHNHLLHSDPLSLGDRYANSADLDPVTSDAAVSAVTGEVYWGDNVGGVDFVCTDTAPDWEVEDTVFGVHGVALHDALADGKPATYGLACSFAMPFTPFFTKQDFLFCVPVDDTHTSYFSIFGPLATEEARQLCVDFTAGPAEHYEDGRYRWTERELWGQDRAKMAQFHAGVEGVVPEDLIVNLSMGPILDRSKETLVPSDLIIVRMRKRLLETARNLRRGIEPYHLSPEESHGLGGEHRLMTDTTNWPEIVAPDHGPLRLAKA